MKSSTDLERQKLSQLIRESILSLCKTYGTYKGHVDIDGIICIAGHAEAEELIIKVHERVIPYSTDDHSSPLDHLRGFNHNALRAFTDYNKNEQILDLTPPKHLRAVSSLNHSYSPQHIYSNFKRPRLETAKHNGQGMGERGRDAMTPSPRHHGDASLKSSPIEGHHGSKDSASLYMSLAPQDPHAFASFASKWGGDVPHMVILGCRQCRLRFDRSEDLTTHNEAVHSLFTCQYCHKTFTSRSNLERHSRLHTGLKPYICNVCGKAFSRKDHLSNHVTKHAYHCGHCSKRYNDKPSLVAHLKEEHKAMLTFHCEFCNRGFFDRELFEDHVTTHPAGSSPQDVQLECSVCHVELPDRLGLMKHKLIHQENHKCFTCLSCAKMYSDPLLYEEHLVTAHAYEANVHECTLCRQIFPSLDLLKKHEQVHVTQHDAEDMNRDRSPVSLSPFKNGNNRCGFCNLEFDSYDKLCDHMTELRHYGKGSPQKAADEYSEGKDDSFSTNSTSAARFFSEDTGHASDVEVVEPEAPEDEVSDRADDLSLAGRAETASGSASTASMQASELDAKHENRSHKRKGISPEKYTDSKSSVFLETYDMDSWASDTSDLVPSGSDGQADRQLMSSTPRAERKRERFLQTRMTVTIPEGPFTCSVCQQSLSNFTSLEQHTFVEHNRCPCMFCPKTFAQKANRDRHVCLHTGDKPYECGECGEKFSRGDKLKLHRLRTHVETLPPGAGQLFIDPSRPGRKSDFSSKNWQELSFLSNHTDVVMRPIPSGIGLDHGDLVHGGGEWRKITDEDL